MLLTTHFMEEADRCDRLALLDGGSVVADGTPAALKEEIGGDVVTMATDDPEALARDLAGASATSWRRASRRHGALRAPARS